MLKKKESALKVAEFLLEIKAVKLQPNDPFTWASGWKSPIYCDNRKTLSHPEIRTYIRKEFAELIREEFGMPDVIAGVATGGIAQGALVAEELNLPFIYVRSSAKGHGLTNQVEGEYKAGQKVLVLEDLVSTGKSSLLAVDALREVGCEIMGMVAIFSYNFDLAQKNMENAACKLRTLSDYDVLIEQALNSNYIDESDLESLKNWRINPSEWKK